MGSCVVSPRRGKGLFRKLKENFGYDTAYEIFSRVITPQFISDFKDTLTIDGEGIPTYESLMSNSLVQDYIGEGGVAKSVDNEYKPMDNTLDNYRNALETAFQFNQNSPYNDRLVATVETLGDKIKVSINTRNEKQLKRFKDQYASYKLNQRLADMFGSLGVTVSMLSSAEVLAGRVGVTDFNKAKEMAKGFEGLIRIANSSEGEVALTEEFAHLIIGLYRDSPLVQRAINALANNENALRKVLGDEYEDTLNYQDNDMSKVAEEALGQILRNNLTKDVIETPAPSLFRRLINWIISQFKSFNATDVADIIDECDNITSKITQEITKGTRKISKEDVARTRREASFNSLAEKIKRNSKLLTLIRNIEIKRNKITKNPDIKKESEDIVNEIAGLLTNSDTDMALGIMNYANSALEELRGLDRQFAFINDMNRKDKFTFLSTIKSYISSYGVFIDELSKALVEDRQEDFERAEDGSIIENRQNLYTRTFEIDGQRVDLGGAIKELNTLSKNLEIQYYNIAKPAFAAFLTPFFGKEVVVPWGKNKGKVMTVESLLDEADSDIGFMDLWLDSMANSSDLILQLFDAAVKAAKDKARLKALERIIEIQVFMNQTYNKGITDFEFIFEKDDEGNKTGNLVSAVNKGQFLKDLRDLEAKLNKKYGKNPTGENSKKKIAERNAWIEGHAIRTMSGLKPDTDIYRNEAFFQLTDAQKEVWDKFHHFKALADDVYPEHRVDYDRAIQVRKTSGQRLMDSTSSAASLLENAKEAIRETFLDAEDDDRMYGKTTGLVDFEGNEYNMLPVLYNSMLKNPNELSTDIFASLIQYTYASCLYEQMDDIVDTLEVGKDVTLNQRKVVATRGGKPIEERINSLGYKITNRVFKNTGTNIEAKLRNFMESQVYLRHIKDEGSFSIFGEDVSISKLGQFLLSMGSMAQLGFHFLANIANVTTGLSMQNIEAAAGQFFKKGTLANADKEFFAILHQQIAECGKRTKTNKVDLFFDLCNVKQDYGSKIRSMAKSLLERFFSAEFAFFGQDIGDRWLYGRTAIAMALEERVLLDGKEMSLWEALQVEDVSDGVKRLAYERIKTLDGKSYDIANFSRRVAHVNQILFGIYNDEDMNAANRVVLGKALQQYRKWMVPAYEHRFQKLRYDVTTGTWVEGYYRTFTKLVYGWARGQYTWAAGKDQLPPELQANINRAIMEMAQFMAVLAIAKYARFGDDKSKKRSWGLKLAEYASKRLVHELGGLAPSPIMPQELLKTVKSPLPIMNVIQNGLNLGLSIIDPSDWTDEIKSGPYKGMSTLHKNFIKSPIPGVAQYRQLYKFVEDIDNSIAYFARPSN